MLDSMTLEDFFTLTEMKNGLTTLARVEELICVMEKQKAYAASNVGDAARQWATVASTLASTENQDCLSHFVYLNGLCFLNQWLQEAVKYTQDATDAVELINVLFGSLEKLPVDRKKLSDSGILSTVEKLLSHKTADIKVKAQTLFERWNTERINDDCCRDLEKGCLNLVESSKPSADDTSVEDKHGEGKNANRSPCQTALEEGNSRNESGRIGKLGARSPNNLHSNTTDDGLKEPIPQQTMKINSSSEEKEKSALISIPAFDSSSFEEKLSVDETSVALVVMASSSAPVSPKVLLKDDDQCSTSATKNHNEIDAEMNARTGTSNDLGHRDSFCVSYGPAASCPEEKSILMCSASAILESKDEEFNVSEPMDMDPSSISADQGNSKHSRTLVNFKSDEESGKGAGNLLDDDGSLLRQEATETANEDNLPLNEPILKECKETDELFVGDPPKISKDKVTEELNTNMDLDLESGEFDALEIARQIAFEVEREVVDYREQSCSSSTGVSSRDIVNTAIPDIAQNKQDHPIGALLNGNGSVSGKDDSNTASSPKNDNCKFLEVTTDLREVKQSLQSPSQVATDQKTSYMIGKIKCDFDLNVDVVSEDFDCPMNPIPSNPDNLSAPIAVSVSNGVPLWAITPLNLEVELGWRGSAATSAFRPASLQRAQDSGKTNSCSKSKENLVEIDLNVADSDMGLDAAVVKEFPVSHCIPYRESSVEVSSGRPARIQLDLNSIGDEEAPSLQSFLSHHPEKRRRTLSSTSSSSSRNPSPRNFDLNDDLFILDGFCPENVDISNSSVFTIMGSKMLVERTDDANQASQTYLGSGLSWEAFMAGRPLMPCADQVPPPGYGYNGLGMAPAFPFQPPFYANSNNPLIEEARSATIMPQLTSPSGPHGAPLSNRPFLMSINGPPLSSNGVESSNPGLDLNSSTLQMEGGDGEARNLYHFLVPAPTNMLEQPTKTTSQHSTSRLLPLKRKEPASGWDSYGFSYNQMTPWH